MFLPPELSDNADWESLGESDSQLDTLRRVYFERLGSTEENRDLDRKLVGLILEHAKKVIAHPSRPEVTQFDSLIRNPQAEFALEESIDESPLLNNVEEFLVETKIEKPFSCALMLDMSSSMSGDKHLIASIAVAVLLMKIELAYSSLILFSSDAKTIKPFSNKLSLEESLLKFLKHVPRGFTNIAKGLESGLKEIKQSRISKKRVGLLASDGRSTEGKDPLEMAKEYDFLVVLHLPGPGSHLEASQAIAQKGNGICLEVKDFQDLPRKAYEAVRILSRR